ncbi:EAL domain-containing protein [Duganella sp. FT3S]|uniref:EAL domain-containing protein n=1 Tax=Rugamonas fusca TaxID=2758568 RepID=A0A7W2EI52_9BURK|nr:EAL domain-containing protein [Rugamonas fusca]MBA5606326.1 EAL domain-containing protein [Rugamonas fusca]
MQNDVRAELELQGELRLALERRQFTLAYQPKVDAHSGAIVALEALLRWQHPRLGWVSPARFIPVAEHYGLMGEIGNWVLQEAIAQLARWRAMGLALRMSINVSPQQLESDDLVSRVYTLLNAHQLEARQVCLEVTESTAMLRPSHTRALLGQLRALGVELSIDDFGTGHSGLSYLYRLPVTELKIDRSFVIALDEGSLPVIEATVKMAKAYGLRVVAEGVELPQQQQALLACGCDEFQGYLFGRPVPAAEIETILLAAQAAA